MIQAGVYTGKHICIYDEAHEVQNYGGFDPEKYEIPSGFNIDHRTYLGGSERFKIKEIEVFQVIH